MPTWLPNFFFDKWESHCNKKIPQYKQMRLDNEDKRSQKNEKRKEGKTKKSQGPKTSLPIFNIIFLKIISIIL